MLLGFYICIFSDCILEKEDLVFLSRRSALLSTVVGVFLLLLSERVWDK